MTRSTRGAVVAVVTVVVAITGACSSIGEPATGDPTGSTPAVPSSPPSSPPSLPSVGAGTVPASVQPQGFSTVTALITGADGEVCEVCVWLADTADERARGLMGVTDLGGAAGMVFRFDAPVRGSFFMLGTPTPLSIAWFGTDGEYVESTDMDPCVDVPEDGCALYGPDREYQLALEVFRGGLTELGVGPWARLELVAGTESDRCP
jgi:uncharacterized membrane protein (UPF0127 family)